MTSLSVNSKLPNVSTTIFTVMSSLANQNSAINLSQGFPHFQPEQELRSLVEHYTNKGFNQYAPMPGVMMLRERLSEKYNKLYGCKVNPEKEITITAGGTQAIFTAILSMIEKDEEAIIFEPAYDCYGPTIELAGGKPIYIKLRSPDFKIPWNEVRDAIGPKTKMILINSPHNPTGSLLNNSDIQELISITRESEIIVLSDEVYEHICFDDRQHLSILKFPELMERAFVIFSFGKTYHCTGWKLGYCIAPEILTTEFRKVHQFNVFSVNTPLQYAFADFILKNEYYDELSQVYETKRDLFSELIKDSRFELLPCHGTYFQLLSYENISDSDDIVFAKRMTIDNKIASIPVSVFYHDRMDQKILRFCFAKDDETLIMAAEKLNNI